MTNGERKPNPEAQEILGAVLAVHNELSDKLNADKERLAAAKGDRSSADLLEDSSINYLQGIVIGGEHAVTALHAFLVARGADIAGKLEPHLANEQ